MVYENLTRIEANGLTMDTICGMPGWSCWAVYIIFLDNATCKIADGRAKHTTTSSSTTNTSHSATLSVPLALQKHRFHSRLPKKELELAPCWRAIVFLFKDNRDKQTASVRRTKL
jgi:hypothetical protein